MLGDVGRWQMLGADVDFLDTPVGYWRLQLGVPKNEGLEKRQVKMSWAETLGKGI